MSAHVVAAPNALPVEGATLTRPVAENPARSSIPSPLKSPTAMKENPPPSEPHGPIPADVNTSTAPDELTKATDSTAGPERFPATGLAHPAPAERDPTVAALNDPEPARNSVTTAPERVTIESRPSPSRSAATAASIRAPSVPSYHTVVALEVPSVIDHVPSEAR